MLQCANQCLACSPFVANRCISCFDSSEHMTLAKPWGPKVSKRWLKTSKLDPTGSKEYDLPAVPKVVVVVVVVVGKESKTHPLRPPPADIGSCFFVDVYIVTEIRKHSESKTKSRCLTLSKQMSTTWWCVMSRFYPPFEPHCAILSHLLLWIHHSQTFARRELGIVSVRRKHRGKYNFEARRFALRSPSCQEYPKKLLVCCSSMSGCQTWRIGRTSTHWMTTPFELLVCVCVCLFLLKIHPLTGEAGRLNSQSGVRCSFLAAADSECQIFLTPTGCEVFEYVSVGCIASRPI